MSGLVVVYAISVGFVQVRGKGHNYHPGVLLEVEEDEAVKLEQHGKVLIVTNLSERKIKKEKKKDELKANTKTSSSDSPGEPSGGSGNGKKLRKGGLFKRRHADKTPSRQRGGKGRKANSKKTS